MGVATFESNTIVKIDGREYKLMKKVTPTLWQLREARTERIIEREYADLLRMYVDKHLTFVSKYQTATFNPAEDLTSEELELAKIRHAYVRAVENVSNSHASRQRAIAELWERIRKPQNPPSCMTVYRWRRRYLGANRDFRGLVDNHQEKGNRKERYPSEVLAACREAIDRTYLRPELNTIQETLEDAIAMIIKKNNQLPESLQLKRPTRRLITRLTSKISAFDKCAAREGWEKARNTYRAVLGHRETTEPLERAEIDHTVLDLFVVDDKLKIPLGRPYVTACIDDYTRCILGLYVGFQPPSYQSVACCLKECFLPKAKLRDQYPEIKSEWRAHGRMRELVLDNGREFHSESLEKMCYSMGIELHYAARKEPQFKGKIERFFGDLNQVAHSIPGTTLSNIFDRGDYDPVRNACVTISNLKAYLMKWITDVYHQRPHRILQTSPAVKWNLEIQPEMIPLPDESIDLDVIMGTACKRDLRHYGIQFENLVYNSQELAQLRRRIGDKQVDIRVNEDDLGSVYVLRPDSKTVLTVPALRADYARGTSLWLHKVLKRRAAEWYPANQDPDGWLKAKDEIRAKIDQDLRTGKRCPRKHVARALEGFDRVAEPAKSRDSKRLARPTLNSESLGISTHVGPVALPLEAEPSDDDIVPYPIMYRKEPSDE